jgi:hypothetical protein
MENIQEFIAVIGKKGGIAKTNRFKIKIYLSGVSDVLSNLTSDGGRDISLLCESVSFPGKTIQSIEFSSYRNPIKIPTGFANEDVSATFHLTNDYYIKKIFDQWLNAIVNIDNYFIAYDKQFKTNIEIYQLNEKDEEVYGVTLFEAYPISMNTVELSNASTNSTQKLTVEFTYNTWVPINIKLKNYVGDVNFRSDEIPTFNGNIQQGLS